MLNTFISIIALLFAIYSIYKQNIESKKLNKRYEKDKFENNLFYILTHHNEIVNVLDMDDKHGKESFEEAYYYFENFNGKILKKDLINPKDSIIDCVIVFSSLLSTKKMFEKSPVIHL